MIEIIKPGLLSTIQDEGRFGFRSCGVPVSGVMDVYSARFVNLILGNPFDMPILEMTLVGPHLKFLSTSIIAISGANMSPKLNGIALKHNVPVKVVVNDILTFDNSKDGARTYLGVKGGFQTSVILGSHSFYAGLTKSSRLLKGDTIAFSPNDGLFSTHNANLKYDQRILDETILDVYAGPEFHRLTQKQKEFIFTTEFIVSELNDRMAYRLDNLIPDIQASGNIVTGPVLPGTVQLTPSGQLIVLMKDAQTTGGYPRVMQLNDRAISILSQKKAGNRIKFRRKAL